MTVSNNTNKTITFFATMGMIKEMKAAKIQAMNNGMDKEIIKEIPVIKTEQEITIREDLYKFIFGELPEDTGNANVDVVEGNANVDANVDVVEGNDNVDANVDAVEGNANVDANVDAIEGNDNVDANVDAIEGNDNVDGIEDEPKIPIKPVDMEDWKFYSSEEFRDYLVKLEQWKAKNASRILDNAKTALEANIEESFREFFGMGTDVVTVSVTITDGVIKYYYATPAKHVVIDNTKETKEKKEREVSGLIRWSIKTDVGTLNVKVGGARPIELWDHLAKKFGLANGEKAKIAIISDKGIQDYLKSCETQEYKDYIAKK